MKKTLIASALSCTLLLTSCSADKADTSNSADSSGNTSTTASTADDVKLKKSQINVMAPSLKAGYRGEEAAGYPGGEAARDAVNLYEPGTYRAYVAYAKNKGRWDEIEKADRVKVGVLYSIYKMRHPDRGVNQQNNPSIYAIPIEYAPDIKDAITQEYEKVYTNYRSRLKECGALQFDHPDTEVTQESLECGMQLLNDRNEYIIKLIREVPVELTPWSDGTPSQGRQDVLNQTSDEKLQEHLNEYVPLYDADFDGQLGYL